MDEENEATKAEARQFMAEAIPSAAADNSAIGSGGVDIAAWKATYASATKDAALMNQFWSLHDNGAKGTSIWTMVYDEADSNEKLDETIEIVAAFMKNSESLKDHCFGVIHTLDSLEIEGLWFFNGPDPEELFGVNEDTSWFSWNQVGPESNDQVKAVVAGILAPADGKLNGKSIEDTQAF